jgi:hypothetical protein
MPRARLACAPDRAPSAGISRECARALASAGLMDLKEYIERFAPEEEKRAGAADALVVTRHGDRHPSPVLDDPSLRRDDGESDSV